MSSLLPVVQKHSGLLFIFVAFAQPPSATMPCGWVLSRQHLGEVLPSLPAALAAAAELAAPSQPSQRVRQPRAREGACSPAASGVTAIVARVSGQDPSLKPASQGYLQRSANHHTTVRPPPISLRCGAGVHADCSCSCSCHILPGLLTQTQRIPFESSTLHTFIATLLTLCLRSK